MPLPTGEANREQPAPSAGTDNTKHWSWTFRWDRWNAATLTVSSRSIWGWRIGPGFTTGGRDLYGGFVASWGVSFGFVYLNVIYGKVMYEGIDTQGRGVLKWPPGNEWPVPANASAGSHAASPEAK